MHQQHWTSSGLSGTLHFHLDLWGQEYTLSLSHPLPVFQNHCRWNSKKSSLICQNQWKWNYFQPPKKGFGFFFNAVPTYILPAGLKEFLLFKPSHWVVVVNLYSLATLVGIQLYLIVASTCIFIPENLGCWAQLVMLFGSVDTLFLWNNSLSLFPIFLLNCLPFLTDLWKLFHMSS